MRVISLGQSTDAAAAAAAVPIAFIYILWLIATFSFFVL